MSTSADIASVANDVGLMDLSSRYPPAGNAVKGEGEADVVDGIDDEVLGFNFKLDYDDTEFDAAKSNPDQPGSNAGYPRSNPEYSVEDSLQDDSTADDAKRRSADGSKAYSPVMDRDSGQWLKKKKSAKSKLSSMLHKKLKIKSSSGSSSQNTWLTRLAGDSDEERERIRLETEKIECEWIYDILPSWPSRQGSGRVRSLIFKGVPLSIRGTVWSVALGNKMCITPELYGVLREQAEQSREIYDREKEEMDNADGDLGGVGGRAEDLLLRDVSAHKTIMLDIPRTYPELEVFSEDDSPYREHLREMLEAFVCLRPEVGYAQGMSFVAGLLLLHMEVADAFCSFVNMISSSCFTDFYQMKMPEVKIYMRMHRKFFREELPDVYKHFKKLKIEPEMYMVKWVMCLFCQSLPLKATLRIWDVYFLDGDSAIFRSAIGILKYFSATLLDMGFEEVAMVLSRLPDNVDEDDLMACIRSVTNVTPKRVKDLYKDYKEYFNKKIAKAAQAQSSTNS